MSAPGGPNQQPMQGMGQQMQGMPPQQMHPSMMGHMQQQHLAHLQHLQHLQQHGMPQMPQHMMGPQMMQQQPHGMPQMMPQDYPMMQGGQMPQMHMMQHMPPMHVAMPPVRPLNAGDHPMMSAAGDQYLVIRRPPPIPEVRVRCGRDEQCVKENGHRGRCSLQHRLREEDMLRLVEKVSTLQTEIDAVKAERDRYQSEVSAYWAGVQKSCTLLSGVVCSKRALHSGASPSADECQAELRAIAGQLFEVEAEERREQFTASLTLLEQSLPDGGEAEPEGARRESELDEYKRQFEQRLAASRDAHESDTELAIAELVPFMLTAPQRLTAASAPAKPAHAPAYAHA